MTIVDRYLLQLFFKIFLICFLSFTGLFVVIHLFSNLDELMKAAESKGGMNHVLLEFYAPRALDIFDRTSGILILISAIFSISIMHRRRELTAVQAAGVSKLRVVRPILFASVLIICLSVANREFQLPQFKIPLVQTAEMLSDNGISTMHMKRDAASGMVFRGDDIILKEKKITNPEIQLPLNISTDFSSIQAEWGKIEESRGRLPRGLRLHQVSTELNLTEIDSLMDNDGNPVVLFPSDQKWLKDRQCYVVCDLDVNELAFGQRLDQYKPITELMEDLRKPKLWFGNQEKIQVHSRILRPFMDITLLLLGLPLVIGRPDQNIFAAAGLCLIVVVLVQLVSLLCTNLGAFGLIHSAALASWLPLIIFLPFTVLSMRYLTK